MYTLYSESITLNVITENNELLSQTAYSFLLQACFMVTNFTLYFFTAAHIVQVAHATNAIQMIQAT